MNISSITPLFTQNYDVGWAGFCYSTNSFISKGIAYFEHWDRYNDIPVSHVFVVAGSDDCIQAMPQGVVHGKISDYFNDPHTLTFFRKPKAWDPAKGAATVEQAEKLVGCHYGYGLIVTDAMASFAVGHYLNKLLCNWPNRIMSKLADWNGKTPVCSVVYATAAQAVYGPVGCLKWPPRIVTPQILFGDDDLFQPWSNQRLQN